MLGGLIKAIELATLGVELIQDVVEASKVVKAGSADEKVKAMRDVVRKRLEGRNGSR